MKSRKVTADKEARISLDENFGTRSLRGRPRLVSTAGDSKSSPESELTAVANNARRDEGIVEFTPRGVLSPANIQSSVHSPLWNGNDGGKGRGRGRGGHQLHGKLRSHYLCAFTPTRAAHWATPCHATQLHVMPRHATPRHATPRHATPRRTVPCRISPQRLSIARQRGHK